MAVVDLGNALQFNPTTLPITCAAAVSAGNLVVIPVFDASTLTFATNFADSKGNTYSVGPSIGNSGNPGGCAIFYSFITTPLTTSDTITYTPGTTGGTCEFSACSVTGYNAHDAATDNTNNNGFATTWSVTGAGAAAVANEINFGFVFSNGRIGRNARWLDYRAAKHAECI